MSIATVDIERLADAIAARLAERPVERRYLTVLQVAAYIGVDASFVRRHSAELGAVRLGDGPKARLRFDRFAVDAWAQRHRVDADEPAPKRQRVAPARRTSPTVELLPVGGAQ